MHALYRNHMGSDLEVALDARISFDASTKPINWQPVEIPNPCENATQRFSMIPVLRTSDESLINFLARGCRSGDWESAIDSVLMGGISPSQAEELLKWVKRMPTHWTPFGQQVVKLRMKAPIPIRTQCFKSKIGFVENEESRRYIKSEPEIFIPDYRLAPEGDIKQGSGGPHPRNTEWRDVYKEKTTELVEIYLRQIADNIAPEQARFILPQGAYVNWIWTGSLYAYAEFCNKRKESHAQGEVQDLAHAISPIMDTLFPVSWAALTK